MFSQAQAEGTIPISLFADLPQQGIPDLFPNDTWRAQRALYDKYWYYYSGDVLKEKVGAGPDAPLKYPAGLNLVKASCQNHAALLVGQPNSGDSLLRFGLLGEPSSRKDKLVKGLNRFWRLNSGDTTLMQQAVNMQIFGGAFYRIWVDMKRRVPITFVPVDPRAVFPVADTYDPDRIISVDIVTEMPVIAAVKRFNIKIPRDAEDHVTVREHWDEDEYVVEVDGRAAMWGDGTEIRGKNIYEDPIMGHKIVPIVYIPRIRTNEFYGESLVEELMLPQDELNVNAGHVGDGIADAMHQQVWVRNRKKGLDGLDFERSHVMDLGSATLGGDSPEVGRLEGAKIDQPVIDYPFNNLLKTVRELSGLPDVAWGRNDGSVRSALTLHYMMYPSINAGHKYRQNFANGIKQLFYKVAVMWGTASGLTSGAGIGFGPDDLQFSTRHAGEIYENLQVFWSPMLPQDRTDLVSELTQRIGTNTISVRTAISKLDGEHAAISEVEAIKEEIKEGLLRNNSQNNTQSQQQNTDTPTPKEPSNVAKARGGRGKYTNDKNNTK